MFAADARLRLRLRRGRHGDARCRRPAIRRPRLFRLAEDRAVINRWASTISGQAAALARLAAARPAQRHRRRQYRRQQGQRRPDRRLCRRACGRWLGVADYLTVNISSPNTPGLRALQDEGALDELLAAVIEARGAGPPVFLKVAPDLERGGDRRHRRGGDRPRDRRADRRQHHDQPAAAALAASRRGGRPFRRAAEGAGAGAAARFPRARPAARCR